MKLWTSYTPTAETNVKIKETKIQLNKHETTICPTCKINFGLTQHQQKCKLSENTNESPIQNIAVQPSTEINVWGNLSIMDLQQIVSSLYEEAVKWKRECLYCLQERPVKSTLMNVPV